MVPDFPFSVGGRDRRRSSMVYDSRVMPKIWIINQFTGLFFSSQCRKREYLDGCSIYSCRKQSHHFKFSDPRTGSFSRPSGSFFWIHSSKRPCNGNGGGVAKSYWYNSSIESMRSSTSGASAKVTAVGFSKEILTRGFGRFSSSKTTPGFLTKLSWSCTLAVRIKYLTIRQPMWLASDSRVWKDDSSIVCSWC